MIVLGLASLVLLSGCGTVVPKVREGTISSFDGNDQNSGVIEITENGALVTPDFIQFYNALIEDYGNKTTPETPRDFGAKKLENGNYLLTLEGLSRMKELQIIKDRNRIEKSGTLIEKIGL